MNTVTRKLVRREPSYEIWSETSLVEFDVEVISDAGDPEGAADMVEEMENRSGRLVTVESAYTPDGAYIGSEKEAEHLYIKLGIVPELIDDHKVCSIGFCNAEKKWYGWSHRAMYGFGIGSSVKRGDCAYMPTDKHDFANDMTRFWQSEHHKDVRSYESIEDGVAGAQTDWTYAEDTPNKKLRATISGVFSEYPKTWGRGEWLAKTLEDAKQMAVDFAEGVS